MVGGGPGASTTRGPQVRWRSFALPLFAARTQIFLRKRVTSGDEAGNSDMRLSPVCVRCRYACLHSESRPLYLSVRALRRRYLNTALADDEYAALDKRAVTYLAVEGGQSVGRTIDRPPKGRLGI
jgi:hypothetical protein